MTKDESFKTNPVEKAAALQRILGNTKDALTLEIGSWLGHGTLGLVDHSKDIVCVDWWKGSIGIEKSMMDYPASPSVYHLFFFNLHPFWDKIHPIIGDHKRTLPFLRDNTFDIICIDADHRYSEVAFDIREAKRLIKPGGLIFGHDWRVEGNLTSEEMESHKEENSYRGTFCGIYLAVTEAFKKFDVEEYYWVVREKL